MRILSVVPKSYLSWGLGHLARLPLPRPLARLSVSLFAQAYSIDHSLSARPIDSFRSVGEFFTRDLKPEVRPIADGPVCPVDGRLRACVPLSPGGEVTQVKGRSFTVEQLLGNADLARRFESGQLWNFYLSPQDAHHIHAPVDGRIVETIHIPGKLWPVNDWALHNVDGLFVVNERVVSLIESEHGLVAVVMVGATNVGRIRLAYMDLVTNRAPWAPKKRQIFRHDPSLPIKRGEKLGTFMMGSSVLVVSEKPLAPCPQGKENSKVQYGRSFSRLWD
jgi:phosphatidylserine decarboxylase